MGRKTHEYPPKTIGCVSSLRCKITRKANLICQAKLRWWTRWLSRRRQSPVWWSQTGSNRRPHACKARALPTELWPLKTRRLSQASKQLALPPTSAGTMVGLGRLELPTSRLSSARSNQLSYKPEPENAYPEPARGTSIQYGKVQNTAKNLQKTARARPGRKRNEGGEVPHIGLTRPYVAIVCRPFVPSDPRSEETRCLST